MALWCVILFKDVPEIKKKNTKYSKKEVKNKSSKRPYFLLKNSTFACFLSVFFAEKVPVFFPKNEPAWRILKTANMDQNPEEEIYGLKRKRMKLDWVGPLITDPPRTCFTTKGS